MQFQFIDHTADCKFEAYGSTIEQVFENAAYALFTIICSQPIKQQHTHTISVTARDKQALLFDFLNQLIAISEQHHFLLGKVNTITITQTPNNYTLSATISGDNFQKYRINTTVKSATYHDMSIMYHEQWIATVVVDL